MLRPPVEQSKYILQAMYEATGQSRAPVDVIGTLAQRWPTASPDDLRAYVTSLAGQGLLMVRADGAGLISDQGVRVLSQLWQDGAFDEEQSAATAEQEEALVLEDEPQEVVELTQPRPSRGAPAQDWTAQSTSGSVGLGVSRVQRLRRELDALTQDLSSATDLPMNEWSQALELTSQLDGVLEALEQLLAPMHRS